MSKVAIILYGMARNFSITSNSIKKHLITPYNSDVFYFGPSYTDRPGKTHSGTFDEDGFFIENPKSKSDSVLPINTHRFQLTYGNNLKDFQVHDLDFSFFDHEARKFSSEKDWIFNLNPARLLSMFYNISGAIDIFLEYAKKNKKKYDACVLTRPDLVFYNTPSFSPSKQTVHIPNGVGFDERGAAYRGNAAVFYYKNMSTGEYIPGNRTENFNDQLIMMDMKTIKKFKNIYDEIKSMMTRKVPLSPETLFYLMVINRKLNIIRDDSWKYEIYREDTPNLLSILDSPELWDIDRHHIKFSSNNNVNDQPEVVQQPEPIKQVFTSQKTLCGKIIIPFYKSVISKKMKNKFSKDEQKFFFDSNNKIAKAIYVLSYKTRCL